VLASADKSGCAFINFDDATGGEPFTFAYHGNCSTFVATTVDLVNRGHRTVIELTSKSLPPSDFADLSVGRFRGSRERSVFRRLHLQTAGRIHSAGVGGQIWLRLITSTMLPVGELSLSLTQEHSLFHVCRHHRRSCANRGHSTVIELTPEVITA
jgi:hypothetical protein